MKFMKLGSRPDTFYTTEAVRSVSLEVSSDLIIQVKGSRYLLHKFPLLSKSLLLQKLCSDKRPEIIQLPDFPGGVESFELCAKFCYGITITLSAHNIVAIRCAAEYLEMTETVEKGNLIHKLDVFFTSCILARWRDTIVVLQSTRALPVWSEDLGITSRCVEAIASSVSANPWKISHTRSVKDDVSSCNGSKRWWGEDLAELGIDHYWRIMIAVRSDGKVPSTLIGDALRIYTSHWLPNISKCVESGSDQDMSRARLILESVISLLPGEKGAVSSSFLMRLLKASNVLKLSASSRDELARRVGLQLDEANVSDLLEAHDVDIVATMLEAFMMQGTSPPTSPRRRKGGQERRRRSRSADNVDLDFEKSRRSSSASHGSRIKVAKIVDGYLQEMAKDKNLSLEKFIAVAEAVPGFARVEHDDLYRAIDIYLKGHPELDKSERKRLCRTLDCKKLSLEACMHAAQNETLPLRVVVQVLFSEHARATKANGQVTGLPNNITALLAANKVPSKPKSSFSTNTSMPQEDQWSASNLKTPKSNISTLRMRLAEDDDDLYDDFPDGIEKHSKIKSLCMIPSRPKRIFSKLLSINRSEKK